MPTQRHTPGPDTAKVAANIRMFMGRDRVTLRDLAERTEYAGYPISAPQLSRMATGDRPVDVDHLRAISCALGVSMGDLLAGVIES